MSTYLGYRLEAYRDGQDSPHWTMTSYGRSLADAAPYFWRHVTHNPGDHTKWFAILDGVDGSLHYELQREERPISEGCNIRLLPHLGLWARGIQSGRFVRRIKSGSRAGAYAIRVTQLRRLIYLTREDFTAA